MLYKMSTKYLWHLKRAPDNIQKTKISQNVDADYHFKLSAWYFSEFDWPLVSDQVAIYY